MCGGKTPLVEVFPISLVHLFQLLVKASVDEGALDVFIEGTEAVGGRDDPPIKQSLKDPRCEK